MYRILKENNAVHERRRGHKRHNYSKPELLATAPNQVWSWDITKLRGPVKGVYYYLYVVIDIFSRYVVGWMLAGAENACLAHELIKRTCEKQGIEPEGLTLHSDRGAPMTSKSVKQLLLGLGVTKSHSRPRVSNDNPYSEAQFKTLKYCPQFPNRFGSEQDARAFLRNFFTWYNNDHHHSGLNLHTPATVHYGKTQEARQVWSAALMAAYEAHPERFVNGPPTAPKPPESAWINPPKIDPTSSHDTTH